MHNFKSYLVFAQKSKKCKVPSELIEELDETLLILSVGMCMPESTWSPLPAWCADSVRWRSRAAWRLSEDVGDSIVSDRTSATVLHLINTIQEIRSLLANPFISSLF